MSPGMFWKVLELLEILTTGTVGKPATEPRPVVKSMICAPPAAIPAIESMS